MPEEGRAGLWPISSWVNLLDRWAGRRDDDDPIGRTFYERFRLMFSHRRFTVPSPLARDVRFGA